ncbi:MAG TPA: hypothetical protein VK766_06300, partial [Cytophagaceae bacterium]|nr:hypothetical protein [Cytophagaceae bacterium]
MERAENNNLRKLIVTNGMIDFFSNDYLGLARSQELSEMIQQECESQHGNLNGSTGSRLLSGNSTYTMKVEEELSILFRAE